VKPFEPATLIPDPALTPQALVQQFGVPFEEAKRALQKAHDSLIFKNDIYQVAVFSNPNTRDAEIAAFGCPVVHLSIKRIDREPIHDWRDLQEIKNMLVGPECEAVEIYPAESRLVDTANQYHLWVFSDPNVTIPLGFFTRLVDDKPLAKAKQRPFKEKP
jgi:hypothetical protein